jgi:hypothetical protein
MINYKTTRAAIAGSIAGAAVAAALFSAGPAAAKPGEIDFGPSGTALHNTPVTDLPGGTKWLDTLFRGESVFVADYCNPDTWCKVWSAQLKTPGHVGWVDGAALKITE